MYFVTSFRSAYYRNRVCSMMLCAVVNGGNMGGGGQQERGITNRSR